MILGIDPSSPTPAYEQIRNQVVAAIADGSLRPGTRLPTVRQLAGDLGLAANTVARAFRELETEGHVATRGRNGTVVLAPRHEAVGDEVVLLGRQDDEVITADEWAERLGTINYEVVCGVSLRVPRCYREAT